MRFYCQECGYKSLKWLGRCPSCGSFDSFVEEKELSASSKKARKSSSAKPKVFPLAEVVGQKRERVLTGISELDHVLGGGIMPSSFILLGGDPGIGKSTLLTQIAGLLTDKGFRVIYLSAEESPEQVRLRAERLGVNLNFYFCQETNLSLLPEVIEEINPQYLFVDSIQTVYLEELSSSPGSVSQVRECANFLMRLAKEKGLTVWTIGHITKEGLIAGPKVLEHLVDVVFYLEGEKESEYRLLRAVKNRFGSVNEVGVFLMTGEGLKPHQEYEDIFLPRGGGAVFCALEGTRPLLVEVQALSIKTFLAVPRRQAVGIDHVRLTLLCAILEKTLGLPLREQDVFVKVAGGLTLRDPASDLAVAVAILSSYLDKPLPDGTVYLGEIGLKGEVKPVLNLTQRLKEAEKKGFTQAFLADYRGLEVKSSLRLLKIRHLYDLMEVLFVGETPRLTPRGDNREARGDKKEGSG